MAERKFSTNFSGVIRGVRGCVGGGTKMKNINLLIKKISLLFVISVYKCVQTREHYITIFQTYLKCVFQSQTIVGRTSGGDTKMLNINISVRHVAQGLGTLSNLYDDQEELLSLTRMTGCLYSRRATMGIDKRCLH